MDIEMSRHALDQSRERGISIKEIETAITRGAKHLQVPHKIVADYTYIRVVYKIINEKCFILTVMIRT